jgi:DNA invertase Pin-like site-specific DNA recombinase
MAAIYDRLSKGPGRKARRRSGSVEQQETENRAECAELGWGIHDAYSDKVSASRFTTKARDDWARLLADLGGGKFGVLVLWESSRGDRTPATWMQLLDLCRERHVLIRITTHHRTYDMSVARDWRVLADDGVDSAYESEKNSVRIRRDVKDNAMAGRPHGKTLYGYVRIYDEHTKELVRQEPDPETAPFAAEVIRRVADNEPISLIERDLTLRRVPGPGKTGKWTRAVIRNLATNPGYIGKRCWNGEILPAMWPPVVCDPAFPVIFQRARRVLSDPARKVTRPGRARWMLSYLATCGPCGAVLTIRPRRRPGLDPLYGCREHGCACIRVTWLDEFVSGAVIGLLSGPAVRDELAGSCDADILAAQAEADRLQAQVDDLARDLSITPRTLAIREAGLLPALRAAEENLARLAVPGAARDLAAHGELMREVWDVMPVAAKKAVIRSLITVELMPATRRGHGFDPARVKIARVARPGVTSLSADER